MTVLGSLFVSLAIILFLLPPLLSLPFPSASSGCTVLCSSLPNSDAAWGIYPAKGSALVEDGTDGNLMFCGKGHSKTIATAPSGGETNCYYGMGNNKILIAPFQN
jgi:hypothetical protein